MKNFILLLLLCAAYAPLFAQIQHGLVREQNSNRRPISGVQVTFADAVPTDSDEGGNFRLAFSGKKPGDLVFFTEIRKNGYEMVNGKELEILKISSNDILGKDIILAKAGMVDAAKKEYYGVSDKELLAGFEREKRALREKLQKAQLNQKGYQDELTALQEQYSRQRKELDALAEKFARVNFDDVDSVYQVSLELFKAGKIDEAIAVLEEANPALQTEKIIEEEKRIAEEEQQLAERKAVLAKAKAEQIAAVRLLADMYSLKFDPAKAEAQYDQLVRLDSTDLEILQDAADFYRKHHRYDKAMRLFKLVISQSKVFAFKMLSDQSGDLKELETAMDIFQQLFEKTGNNHYMRKLEICRKMKSADADYKGLIVEMSSF